MVKREAMSPAASSPLRRSRCSGPLGLEIPELDHCPYCEAFAGRRPYAIAHLTTDAGVLVTPEQRLDPHLLVVPKRHVPTLVDLDDREACILIRLVKRTVAAVVRAGGVGGVKVWQNNGVPAHQSVPHTHFHVGGCRPGQSQNWGRVPTTPTERRNEIARQIAAAW